MKIYGKCFRDGTIFRNKMSSIANDSLVFREKSKYANCIPE